MLFKEFIIKDIIDYEILHDCDILGELSYGNIDVLVDLVKMSDKCDDVTACNKVDGFFKEYGYEHTFELVAYEVIGREPENKNDEHTVKDYKTFSEVLENFYNEMQAIDGNLGLSDFWQLSTRYMYKYSDGLKDRYIFNLNKQSQEQFLNAETFIGLLFGKLKEPLHFNDQGQQCKAGQEHMTLKEKILAVKNHEL